MIITEHKTAAERLEFAKAWMKAVERQRRLQAAVTVIRQYLSATTEE